MPRPDVFQSDDFHFVKVDAGNPQFYAARRRRAASLCCLVGVWAAASSVVAAMPRTSLTTAPPAPSTTAKPAPSPVAPQLAPARPPQLPARPWLSRDEAGDLHIVPSRKLVVCALPKVGSLSWRHLLDELNGNTADDALKYRSHGMSLLDVHRAVADQAWTKVVLFRDPVVRFLSAYLDKCVRSWGRTVAEKKKANIGYCVDEFGTANLTLGEAISSMTEKERSPTHNRHFKMQSAFCGLHQAISHYQVVHEFGDPRDVRESVRKVLRAVGIENASSVRAFAALYPPQGERVSRNSHSSGAASQLREHFCGVPQTVYDQLVRFYRSDYAMFNMTPQSYEHLCSGANL